MEYVHSDINDYVTNEIEYLIIKDFNGDDLRDSVMRFSGLLQAFYHLDKLTFDGFVYLTGFASWLLLPDEKYSERKSASYSAFYDLIVEGMKIE